MKRNKGTGKHYSVVQKSEQLLIISLITVGTEWVCLRIITYKRTFEPSHTLFPTHLDSYIHPHVTRFPIFEDQTIPSITV
ncbi:hypothetical protein WAI453_004047 [Rhynchosporium graminicola]